MLEKLVTFIKDKNNFNDVMNVVGEINSFDGSLDHLEYWNNDEEFFEVFFEGKSPMEVARAICYGDYKYSDDYVKFNGYGNLVSYNQWELEMEFVDNAEEIAEKIIESEPHIWMPREIEEIFWDEEVEEEE